MKTKTLLAILLVLGTVTLGLAGKTKTRARSQPGFDFADHQTYAWAKGTPAVHVKIQDAIVSAVDAELAKRGLAKTDTGKAALLVSTYAFAQGEIDVVGRSYWGAYGGFLRMDIDAFKKGVLYIKIVGPGSEEPLWQGLAGKAINGNPDKIVVKVAPIVARVFETPPEPIEKK